MKIGMNMLLWTDHVSEKDFPRLEMIKEIGYDGVEIPLGRGDIKHYTTLSRKIKELGLLTTCVTSLLKESNIASPDSKTRAAGLEHMKWAIDMASILEADIICGPFHSAFAYFTGIPPSTDEKKWSVEMLHKMGDYAAQENITLAPEALNRFECYLINTMQDMYAHLDEVNHTNVGAIFDTHHANIEEKSQKEAIETIAPFLKHVHLSENDRGALGSGQVNWKEVFTSLKSVKYDGWLTLEAFSRSEPDFANAINVWREYSPKDQICNNGFHFIHSNWYK